MKTQSRLQEALIILIGLFFYTESQAQFLINAEVRPRTEFRNGFKTPRTEESKPAFFTEQRSRIYLGYQEEKFKVQVTFQDVRVWGASSQIFKRENGNSFLSEAWGEYSFNSKFSLKAGRQMLSYDNQRFLGGLEWAQQGRRHDAFLFKYEDEESKLKFHAGFALNNDDDIAEPAFLQSPTANFYSVGGNYKRMQFGWFNKKTDNSSLSILALNATLQNADSTNSNKQTFGVIGLTKIKGLTLAADVYYQTGKIGSNQVNALLAGINATIKTKITPLTLGVEYISGKNDDDLSTDITNFSPDYGTNHAFNDFMDYCFVGPANGNVGVTDFYLKSKFKIGKGSLNLRVHEFLTGSKQIGDEGQELSKMMGTEVDLVYGMKLSPSTSLAIGYSQMFGTNTLIALRPGTEKLNNWAFMMLTFKPKPVKIERVQTVE